ncbi:MAG: metallophosphoesterase family protein, partial [Akkermansiaceae bacterium]|nr:metallophosphoesterase family protein [Akkermansiaceae bacterium]
MPFHHAIITAACLLLPGNSFAQPAPLIPKGAVWKYLDDGSDQGIAWRNPGFADQAWKSGKAKLGYSDGAVTPLGFGPQPGKKFITSYFRREFTVTAPRTIPALKLELLRDDGAVVYLNGVEVARSNMPAGRVSHTTPAIRGVIGSAENAFFPIEIPSAKLVTGRNLLAVEVHQDRSGSSDLGFDLCLTVMPGNPGALVRGPYLQQASPGSIVIRWRTAKPELGTVKAGLAADGLAHVQSETVPVTDHEIGLTGLRPATRYFYSVGNATDVLAGPEAGCFFTTPPTPGTPQATRIWVLGDAGTANIAQARVRNAFYSYAGERPPDLCLLLGDNAYDTGSDREHQQALFDMYPAMLRRVPFWSCLGNHETAQSVSYVNTYPYFEIFTFPTKGECGGVTSGTEHYYSFDYANIHFISLDSMTANRAPDGAMATWLTQDLASTTATWIIAFFHHPPYTKGSHNSDTEGHLIEMRRNFLPILEDGGVDLVLGGHSHAYERSFLLDGHYGLSNTLTDAMKIDPGDGRPDGNGAYLKPPGGRKAHLGTVYNVTGSAGHVSGGPLNHPAMFLSANELGSVVLDIKGDRLDST